MPEPEGEQLFPSAFLQQQLLAKCAVRSPDKRSRCHAVCAKSPCRLCRVRNRTYTPAKAYADAGPEKTGHRPIDNGPRLGRPCSVRWVGLVLPLFDQQTTAERVMTRWLLRAIDIGGSAVFTALYIKAVCVQFYQDITGQLERLRLGRAGPRR